MSEKEKLLLEVDKRVGKTPKWGLGEGVKNVVKTIAVAAWLAFAQDAVAQDPHVYYPIPTSGITIPYQAPAENKEATISWDEAVKLCAGTASPTITLDEAVKWPEMEPDTIWWEVLEWWDGPDGEAPQETVDTDASPDTPETPDTTKKEESKISIGWMVGFGSGVAADAAEVCSSNPELLWVLNVSHKKTGLWISLVRLDDFSESMSNPVSQVTIVNPYWSTKLWPDGKFSVTAEWKYSFFDKIPELNWFSPDIKLAYSDKGWTVETMYTHKFQKWADSDAFRLSVSKTFDEIFQLTAQWWYETGYDKHFYGRLIATVDLWHGLLVEMSFIAKHWKITPTAWILYRFQR